MSLDTETTPKWCPCFLFLNCIWLVLTNKRKETKRSFLSNACVHFQNYKIRVQLKMISCNQYPYRKNIPKEEAGSSSATSDRTFCYLYGSSYYLSFIFTSCVVCYRTWPPRRTPTGRQILEALGNYDLWIWHFFCMTWLYNDIVVLQRSPVFAGLAEGQTPMCNMSSMVINTPRRTT
jgi:hypothetical protein